MHPNVETVQVRVPVQGGSRRMPRPAPARAELVGQGFSHFQRLGGRTGQTGESDEGDVMTRPAYHDDGADDEQQSAAITGAMPATTIEADESEHGSQ